MEAVTPEDMAMEVRTRKKIRSKSDKNLKVMKQMYGLLMVPIPNVLTMVQTVNPLDLLTWVLVLYMDERCLYDHLKNPSK